MWLLSKIIVAVLVRDFIQPSLKLVAFITLFSWTNNGAVYNDELREFTNIQSDQQGFENVMQFATYYNSGQGQLVTDVHQYKLTERFKIELKTEVHMKSKCGVSPLITQPSATNPSYFFKFFFIAIGISYLSLIHI